MGACPLPVDHGDGTVTDMTSVPIEERLTFMEMFILTRVDHSDSME
jgi:hypothetical protein